MKLNNAQDAIKQAIEGGWKPPENFEFNSPHHRMLASTNDPLFWQALGKVRGWSGYWDIDAKCPCVVSFPEGRTDITPIENHYAHEWFETRLSNGDETKFWQSLP